DPLVTGVQTCALPIYFLPSPTEADNKLVRFDAATASLLRIGAGFDQVTKNGSDLQPRVGVIWNPTGDGRTAVRAAYAVMVNQTKIGRASCRARGYDEE